jgi:hypothetical protein
MFSKLTNALVSNQDVIVRRAVGLGSIAAGMAINSMLNKPAGPKNVVVVENVEVVVEEPNTTEEAQTTESE